MFIKELHTKIENVDNFFVYVFRGIGDNLCNLKRVNAHAERRELLLQFLITFLSIPQLSENKNLKADVHPICPFLLHFFLQPIGICGFKG